MIVHAEVIQGSQEWLRLRSGIPTSSQFDKILTAGGKPSTQAKGYLHTLLAERIMGHPTIEAVSTWMSRGSSLEAEAVSFYENIREIDTVKVGFITNDAGSIGASPDRLVGDCGLLEIKVPKEGTHVIYLLGGGISDAYKCQVQGQLWIAEKQWSDTLSFHPEMPPALVRCDRDDAFISLIAAAVTAFSDTLEAMALDLTARGYIKPVEQQQNPQAEDPLFLNDDDLSAFMKHKFGDDYNVGT